ncbi:MAG: helix-turn-helix domain-containing protein [Candidatus Doudnabacteria bacterium]|nr:helix-turn-helix domain-containing protein [Candidatus Doudnabacteria bacterium]
MYQEILNNLGLTPNEAKIYEFLVEKGESGISAIAIGAQIYRRNAYDAIQRLQDKGLVFQIFSSSQNFYNAVDPDKLSELVSEKQTELQKILPELKHKFAHRLAAEEAYIYRGYEGLKNVWRDIVRVKEPVYTIGAKAQWLDPRLEAARQAFFVGMKKEKIKHYLLFDSEVPKQVPDFEKRLDFAKQFRFLPKDYSTGSVINIFGDYVVTYTGISIGKIQDSDVVFVLHSHNLAESYRKWFWYMWEKAEK